MCFSRSCLLIEENRRLLQIIGFSTDTMIACLIDELEVLRSSVAMNGTLSSNQTDIIIAHLQRCLSQDTVAQQILQDRVDGRFTLDNSVETTLNIESNVGRDKRMEIDETPGSFLLFKPIKLSAMDTFLHAVQGNGDKVFQSFEIFDNTHEVGG